jgi:ribulose-phosphate 3-epimerase
MRLSPTLACADRLDLKKDLDTLMELGAPLLHIDIMDAHYVPNLCFDFDTARAIGAYSRIPLDVHLMIDDPFRYLDRVAALKPEFISFHPDTTPFGLRFAGRIRQLGCKAGVALNPCDRVESLEHILPHLDLVQVMGVEPGFAGQRFVNHTLDKIERLAKMRTDRNLCYEISVDGGIDVYSGRECLRRGADILVAGALAVFLPGQSLRYAWTAFMEGLME